MFFDTFAIACHQAIFESVVSYRFGMIQASLGNSPPPPDERQGDQRHPCHVQQRSLQSGQGEEEYILTS
jgi:hypothetical protein